MEISTLQHSFLHQTCPVQLLLAPMDLGDFDVDLYGICMAFPDFLHFFKDGEGSCFQSRYRTWFVVTFIRL
jgi:hypothetical protein